MGGVGEAADGGRGWVSVGAIADILSVSDRENYVFILMYFRAFCWGALLPPSQAFGNLCCVPPERNSQNPTFQVSRVRVSDRVGADSKIPRFQDSSVAPAVS